MFGEKQMRAVLLSAALLCAAAWADQDDDNADLKPTPEENARAAIVKRWPDAKEIDVVDLTDEGDDADERPLLKAAEKDADADAEAEADDLDEEDPAAHYTLSVTFESGGHDFEALLDDEGKIKYIYEDLPLSHAPSEIIAAALLKVKDRDLVYVDRVLDETHGNTVQSYIIGLGDKDVYLDAEGEVTAVEDAPDEEPEDAETLEEGGVV